MKSFSIYFSDLTREAQERLLEVLGADEAADMNWDLDIIPIATYDFEESEDK